MKSLQSQLKMISFLSKKANLQHKTVDIGNFF